MQRVPAALHWVAGAGTPKLPQFSRFDYALLHEQACLCLRCEVCDCYYDKLVNEDTVNMVVGPELGVTACMMWR